MQITIKSIHVTVMHEKTWGRVYIQYEQNNEKYFILKNWLYFDEKTYKSIGSLLVDETVEENGFRPHHIYLWFPPEKRHVFQNYQDVLNGAADKLLLTTKDFKEQYGTPSIILKRLLIELKANIGEPLVYRKDWFKKYQIPPIVLSPIVVNTDYEIRLSLYDNMEISFEPLLKLVYILFLNHPEGIVLANFKAHKDELFIIYLNLMKDDDYEKIQTRISKLIDRDGNGLHEKISKINKIFKVELGDKISPYYQITGSKEQPYKINLSADLIKMIK